MLSEVKPQAIVLIDAHDAAQEYNKILKKIVKRGLTPVALVWDEALLNKLPAGAEIIRPDSTGANIDTMYNIAVCFSQKFKNWYFDGEKDLTEIDGISFGSTLELSVYGIFKNSILKLEGLKSAVAAHRPAVCITFWPEGSLKCVSEFIGGQNTEIINFPPNGFRRYLKTLEIRTRSGFLGWATRYIKTRSRAKRERRKEPNFKGKRVLMVYSGNNPSGLDTIAPVKKEFSDGAVISLAEKEETVKALKKRNISGTLFEEIGGAGCALNVLFKRGRFLRFWKRKKAALAGSLNFIYKGISVHPLVEDALDNHIKRNLNGFLFRTAAVKSFLKAKNIGSILVSSDFHPLQRETLAVGNKMGIPSVIIPHGLMVIPIFYVPVTATKTAVWGEFMRDQYIGFGTDPEKIVITGQPRYDAMVSGNFDREDICRKLGLDSKKKIILFATSVLPLEAAVVEQCIEALDGICDIQFLIKLHPGEKSHSYEGILKRNPKPFVKIISPDANIFELLFVCDINMFIISTIGYEAALMDKPMVIANFGGNNVKSPFVEHEVAVEALSREELKEAVLSILGGAPGHEYINNNRRKFRDRYNLNDGKSAHRVADLLNVLHGQNLSAR